VSFSCVWHEYGVKKGQEIGLTCPGDSAVILRGNSYFHSLIKDNNPLVNKNHVIEGKVREMSNKSRGQSASTDRISKRVCPSKH